MEDSTDAIISVPDKEEQIFTPRKSQIDNKRIYENHPEQTNDSTPSASQTSEGNDESSIFRSPSTELTVNTDEESPVDFHTARRLLVERSKTNGNPVKILSRVHKRVAMFEKIEKDSRRRPGPQTLLKSSWKEAEDGRRNSYVKKYAQNICPKKSIDQLP